MRERISSWTSRLQEWFRPGVNYLTAGCLGAAGILFTRAFPSSDFNDIAFDMLLASALFFLGGLLLRLFWGREDVE